MQSTFSPTANGITSKPRFLVKDIGVDKFLITFCQIDDAMVVAFLDRLLKFKVILNNNVSFISVNQQVRVLCSSVEVGQLNFLIKELAARKRLASTHHVLSALHAAGKPAIRQGDRGHCKESERRFCTN